MLDTALTQRYNCVKIMKRFDKDGCLQPGIHEMSWQGFVKNFGTNPQRLRLISGIEDAIKSLKKAGCNTMYVNGSFVTAEEFPNDYDACWDVTGVDPSLLDPILLQFKSRAAMKTKYLGDLFPAHFSELSTGRTFLDFFQTDKSTGKRKGLIKLNLKGIKNA